MIPSLSNIIAHATAKKYKLSIYPFPSMWIWAYFQQVALLRWHQKLQICSNLNRSDIFLQLLQKSWIATACRVWRLLSVRVSVFRSKR